MKRREVAAWPRTIAVGGTKVRVYRRRRTDGSWGYEVADYSTGRRKLRSFAEPKEALAVAERIARFLAAGQTAAAQFSAAELSAYGRAIENLRATGVAIELATATYAKALEILRGKDRILEACRFFADRDPGNLPPRTVAECVEEFLTLKKSRGASPRYLADLRARLARFVATFQIQIAAVTGAALQKWLDGLRLGPQSVKNFRTVLRTLFGFAEARGYIARGLNPVEATEAVKARNKDAVEIYSPGELARLLAAAPEDFRPLVALGAFAGVRSAELARLQWPDIDLAGGFVTVGAAKAKTASRRIVPVCPALREWLAPWAGQTGKVWDKGELTLRRRREATAKAAGVPWKANGLRHSYASYRLAATQDAAKVALEMGNSPAVVFRHYRELVKPAEAERWFAIRPGVPENVLSLSAAGA